MATILSIACSSDRLFGTHTGAAGCFETTVPRVADSGRWASASGARLPQRASSITELEVGAAVDLTCSMPVEQL